MAATRTPHQIARTIRATAARLGDRPEDELLLTPEAQAAFTMLLRSWADDLDGLPRPALGTAYTAETLSNELEDAAAALSIDAMVAGDGQIMFSATDAREHIDWLRDCARRVAILQAAAAGFRFIPVGELPPDPGPALPDHAGQQGWPNGDAGHRHPEGVVPATVTGTGAVVTHALLDRLARRRRFRAAPSGGSAA